MLCIQVKKRSWKIGALTILTLVDWYQRKTYMKSTLFVQAVKKDSWTKKHLTVTKRLKDQCVLCKGTSSTSTMYRHVNGMYAMQVTEKSNNVCDVKNPRIGELQNQHLKTFMSSSFKHWRIHMPLNWMQIHEFVLYEWIGENRLIVTDETDWVWGITGWSSKLQENYPPF